MRCPKCKNRVIQRAGSETRFRVKGRQTLDAEGRFWAQCYWCGEKVQLPLQLVDGTPIPTESFYVQPEKPSS